jgi:hypothetical protein
MKSALSVNAALDELATLEGQDIATEGVLRFEFEGTALDHFPKSERRNAQDDGPLKPSSVWLSAASGALRFNEEQLRRWHGKRVTVLGTLLGPDKKARRARPFFGVSCRGADPLHRAALVGQHPTFVDEVQIAPKQTLGAPTQSRST